MLVFNGQQKNKNTFLYYGAFFYAKNIVGHHLLCNFFTLVTTNEKWGFSAALQTKPIFDAS
jgi:hypothetical protein